MSKDFKRAEENGNGKLSYREFRKVFNPLYQFLRQNPNDYDFFQKTDIDKNGRITLDEFEQINYVFSVDSFWDEFEFHGI